METVRTQELGNSRPTGSPSAKHQSAFSIWHAGKEALAWVGIGLLALVFCALELVLGETR